MSGVKLFTYPGPHDPCILFHTQSDRYVAYSQKCTHLSCACDPCGRRKADRMPCHHGFFSVEDGRVLQGPPPRPLPRILLDQQGDELMTFFNQGPEQVRQVGHISRDGGTTWTVSFDLTYVRKK